MAEFELDVNYKDLLDEEPEQEKRAEYNICCDNQMMENLSNLICQICGKCKVKRLDKATYTTSYNSGPTCSKPSVRRTKTAFVVYPSYTLIKAANTKSDFSFIKNTNMHLDNRALNQARYIYNMCIINTGITKKGVRKDETQMSCVFLGYEIIEEPMTKLEFCTRFDQQQSSLTRGLKVIRNSIDKYNIEIILKTNLELISDFINKLKPEGTSNYDKVLLNMGNIVRDNQYLNQNKTPECLAAGIIAYTNSLFKHDPDILLLCSASHISYTTVYDYYNFLLSILNSEHNRFATYFILIRNKFC
jgi:hypothetical protein